jgi:hypothetical protein
MTIAVLCAMGLGSPEATAFPTVVTGARSGAGDATTSTTTVTVTGGTTPYTILWARTGGDSGPAATAGTAFTTAFSGTLAIGESLISEFTGTVTDANGATDTVVVTSALYEIS